MKKTIIGFLICSIIIFHATFVYGDNLEVVEVANENVSEMTFTSNSVVLIEAESGKIIYEKDSDKQVSPASITKIMTLLLIFENIENGKIGMEDLVTVSANAKSMGGSQVFLEEGEVQTVETLIKCIVVASGNDASVCMAEYIAGSEENFVKMMNDKAVELGMKNTVFKDCCGLCDSMEHHTTAYDVGIMSMELITKYPDVLDYSGIWMENILHKTNKGESEFTLANTNKLLKQYEYCTGLKTGSTSLAGYCLSATATKEEITLIAVVMGAADYKMRFSEAKMLLQYGFDKIAVYKDDGTDINPLVNVKNGRRKQLRVKTNDSFAYSYIKDENVEITKKVEILNNNAPIKKGSVVGNICYYNKDELVGCVDIIADESVEKISYVDYLKKMWYKYLV